MRKNRKLFTLYEMDEFGEDFQNVWQYEDIDELLQDTKRHDIKLLNRRSVFQYITPTSDKIDKLINDRYFIISEDL